MDFPARRTYERIGDATDNQAQGADTDAERIRRHIEYAKRHLRAALVMAENAPLDAEMRSLLLHTLHTRVGAVVDQLGVAIGEKEVQA